MLSKPKLKTCYSTYFFENNTFLISERYQQILPESFSQLVPLLDGQRSFIDIVETLEGKLGFAEVISLLQELDQNGYTIEGGTHDITPDQEIFWHTLGVDARSAIDSLVNTAICLDQSPGPEVDRLSNALARYGIRVGRDGGIDGGIKVVFVSDYLSEQLADMGRNETMSVGNPWIPCKLTGTKIWIGPIFNTTGGSCYSCFSRRLRENRQLVGFLQERDLDPIISDPTDAAQPLLQLGVELLATELYKFVVASQHSRISDNLLVFDALTTELSLHAAPKYRACKNCGPALDSQPALSGPGDWGASPEETLERFSRHVSPITGIVTWLEETTPDNNGLWYTFSAGHNYPLIKNDVQSLVRNLRSGTGGKGSTRAQAKVSAMAEAFERYSVSWRGDQEIINTSYKELPGIGIRPNDLLNFSDLQFASRQHWNAEITGTRFHVIPNRFDDEATIEWIRVKSLTGETERFVPASLCYVGHPDTHSYFFCTADTNGCAAGVSDEDAIVRGFLELVERDAVAIWWYNKITRPRVDLDTFSDPRVAALRDYYREKKREFWVLDITTDLGIPTFAAISVRIDRDLDVPILGCASDFEAPIALRRAIEELNQFLPAVLDKANSKGSQFNFPDREAIDWWTTAKSSNYPYLRPNQDAAKALSDFRRKDAHRNLSRMDLLRSRVAQAQLEPFVLNHTRPEIGMPVWRVLVPGLRHFWRRLGPGRLFDVPVRLDWLSSPTPENDMNPQSIFF